MLVIKENAILSNIEEKVSSKNEVYYSFKAFFNSSTKNGEEYTKDKPFVVSGFAFGSNATFIKENLPDDKSSLLVALEGKIGHSEDYKYVNLILFNNGLKFIEKSNKNANNTIKSEKPAAEKSALTSKKIARVI